MPGRRVSMPNRAVDLERRIDALDFLPDELELIGRLDRRLEGERDPGGVGRELAEGRRAPGGFIADEAAARDARRRFDAPSRGRGGDQPRTGRGARLLQE